jgi:hypothetical protein
VIGGCELKKIIAAIVLTTFMFAVSGVSFASLNLTSDPAYSSDRVDGYVPVIPPQPKKISGYVPVIPPQPKKISGYVPVIPPQPKKISGYVPVIPPQPKK